ncbi:PREDICTED: uncharacterized protein LOC107162589 [Diuraphis noxia]|uniref:uncharacterized protein LOC107162589 n=1 Tax=Diuraphis noxia TaxID=143948 RepID=UPI000763B5D7|nr:PREDICTED: uncharacterized protein LOC107162589 [Diuraphis noxia]
MDDASIISSLTKIKVHSLKRKASSSVESKRKQKRFKSDDTCSELSMTTSEAYGIKKITDDSDIDDDQSFTNKPAEFIRLDTSQLNRNNGVLFSEDLNNDCEVWTFQCPDDIDINNLLSQSISFNDIKKLEIKNTMSDKVDLIPYRCQEKTNITIVTPCEKTKDLSLNVVPLAGTLIMCNRIKKDKLSNNVLLPVDTIEDATRRRSELMSKITKRLSNKYDINSVMNTDIKQEFKLEKESPRKVKKNKKKLINK